MSESIRDLIHYKNEKSNETHKNEYDLVQSI